MAYQLADLINGCFGEVYETFGSAEEALNEVVAAGQEENNQHAQEYLDAGRPIPDARDMFFIVPVSERGPHG